MSELAGIDTQVTVIGGGIVGPNGLERLRRLPDAEPGDLLERRFGIRAQAVGTDGFLIDDFNAPSPPATAAFAMARSLRKPPSTTSRTPVGGAVTDVLTTTMSETEARIAAVRDRLGLHDACLIGGAWVQARSGDAFDSRDPATGALVARLPRCGDDDARAAIRAAAQAQPRWRAMTAKDRGRILRRIADLMLEHQEDLAELLTLEQGKPLAESRAEIAGASAFFEWYAEEGKRVYGETIPTYSADRRILVLREPIGVSAGITPWNFPCAMVARKAAPALAAGCTMILKPAEQTPAMAVAVAQLAIDAGLPPGVVNVITGDEEDAPAIGRVLTADTTVRKVSFTGSTAIGRLLLRQSSETIKNVTLELGGNAPFIVFDDADIPPAVQGAMAAKFRNAGQTCVAANRVLVHESIASEFTEQLLDAVAQLRVGSGLEPEVVIGPLIDTQAVGKVREHIENAVAAGALLHVGGNKIDGHDTFFEPTVLSSVRDGISMSVEETFGPVVGLQTFSNESEAIARANATEYGLAAYFYTRSLSRAWRVMEALECGVIGVNTGMTSTEVAPFGGMKQSGLGREGSHHGIEDWLETKYIAMAGLDA